MIKEITASGKDIMEAKENARLALGASELDDVNYEILHAGSRGIFGIIGVKPAMVKAYIELPDAEPRRERKNKENRPAKENKPQKQAQENAPATEKTEKSEKNNSSRRKNRNDRRKPVEKASAVFESELTFTKLEVEEGQDRAFDFVKQLIENIGIEANVELFSCDDGTRRINITGEPASMLIGHHGDTLDALQYLANLASAQKNAEGVKDKSRVTVNIEGYRAKREETLRTLARSKAAQALRTHRNVMLEPMSPYERRIIHSEIQSIEGVTTNSIGNDTNRKVVIMVNKAKKAPQTEEVAVENEVIAEVANETEIAAEVTASEDEVSEQA
ncbi:MAG: Jag N-terminal domain-containing protein [Clostridia bacterium]|nr:Jag N-terminal domain-containing protein [Clostridia bacterium]